MNKFKNMFKSKKERCVKVSEEENMFKSRKETCVKVSEEENMIKIVLEQLEIEKTALKVLLEHLEHMISKKIAAGEDTSCLISHLDKLGAVEFLFLMIGRDCASILENATLLREKCSFLVLSPQMQNAIAGIVFVSRRFDPSKLSDGLENLREALKERYAPPCGGDTWEKDIVCKVNERLRLEGDYLRCKLSPENEEKKKKQFGDRERKEKRYEGLVLKKIWINKMFERLEENRDTDNDDELLNDSKRKELKFKGLVLDSSWIRDFGGRGNDTIYIGCTENEALGNERVRNDNKTGSLM